RQDWIKRVYCWFIWALAQLLPALKPVAGAEKCRSTLLLYPCVASCFKGRRACFSLPLLSLPKSVLPYDVNIVIFCKLSLVTFNI
ncbi:MAG: hypothetical protein KGZ79_13005, partial [Dethiobacter sp.]|nr:hypothetical protein [Dethiobacter sp.]